MAEAGENDNLIPLFSLLFPVTKKLRMASSGKKDSLKQCAQIVKTLINDADSST